MSVTPIDLARLPAPDVIETIDFETLYAERKARLVSLYPADQQAAIAAALETESEPMAMLLQESAYREVVLRQRVNDAARSVMLAYATNGNLDHLAALFGIERLKIREGDPANNVPDVYESCAELRRRTQIAPQSFSVAGPEGAYKAHALNADGRVLDASATSPAPCEVLVTILSREGDGTASGDLIDAVTAALRADDVRPLTDKVTVQSAGIVPYKVAATIYTFPGPDSGVVLDESRASLTDYIDECHRLGREATLSGIYAALHVPGVERVELHEPTADIRTDKTQAPYCTECHVKHGGIYG